MKISEKQLRSVIRKTIIKEITNFGFARGGDVPGMKAQCSWEQPLPGKIAAIFSQTGGDVQGALKKAYPEISLGPKLAKDASVLQTLMTEFSFLLSKYWYASGGPCVSFFFANKALETLAAILGVVGSTEVENVPKPSGNVLNIDFTKPIKKKASEMAPSSRPDGVKSNSVFYVFPKLTGAKSSGWFFENKKILNELFENDIFDPDDGDNLENLSKDLENYEKKIQSIRNVSNSNLQSSIDEIADILEVEIDFDLSGIESDSTTLDEIQASAIGSLGIMFKDASTTYEHVPKYNKAMADFADRAF